MLELYTNIKNKRLALGLTQAELANETGYSGKSMIARIEKGDVDLPLSKVDLFAEALNTTPSELMGDSWESDILANARIDIVDHLEGDAFKIAQFQEAEVEDMRRESALEQNSSIAAHFEGEEFTDDEIERIKEFARFIKKEKNKQR